MWTAVIAKSADVSTGVIGQNKTPVGIKVIAGPALCMFISKLLLKLLCRVEVWDAPGTLYARKATDRSRRQQMPVEGRAGSMGVPCTEKEVATGLTIPDLTWVAFALEVFAFIPYLISCCTFKREREELWK